MDIVTLSRDEIDLVFGGKAETPPVCTYHIPDDAALGYDGLVVGCTYIREGDQPLDVTVTKKNSDGSYQVRDNNTGMVMTHYTPSGGG